MASLDDILTAAKNIVTAINGLATTYTAVNGALSAQAISIPTVVSSKAGRLATVSITTAGSAAGTIYDSASLTDTSRPIGVIPNMVEIGSVNLPVAYGIVVVPGTGQVVTVGYA